MHFELFNFLMDKPISNPDLTERFQAAPVLRYEFFARSRNYVAHQQGGSSCCPVIWLVQAHSVTHVRALGGYDIKSTADSKLESARIR